MQNVKFLARLFLKLQENGPLLSARPRIYVGSWGYLAFENVYIWEFHCQGSSVCQNWCNQLFMEVVRCASAKSTIIT